MREEINFGGGLKWVSERKIADYMELSVPAFRKLCRALQVPMIEPPGHGGRLVNQFMFNMAMWAVSRIGQPDFLVPGCPSLNRSKEQRRTDSTSELDPHYLRADLQDIVAEMFAARKVKGMVLDRDMWLGVRIAAERMMRQRIHVAPSVAMRENTRDARRKWARENGTRQQNSLLVPTPLDGEHDT